MEPNKLYSNSLIDNRVTRPRPVPDEYDSVWELTEISPNRYQIGIWKEAHKRILANPSFIDGADKQIVGRNVVQLVEPGIAERNADGRLVVIKKPKVHLLDREMENNLAQSAPQTSPTNNTKNTDRNETLQTFKQATANLSTQSGNKLYSNSLLDNKVSRPRPVPDEYDSVWELTEISPNRYQIGIWKEAHKRILANPSFIEGADKQIVGRNVVQLVEPGIAERNADGRLVVIKKPKVHLLDREMENNFTQQQFKQNERM